MKKILMCIVLFVSLVPLYADEPCDRVRRTALELFHSGQYYQAKKLFQEVSDKCGKNYQNVDAMLQLCNSALRTMDTILLVDNSCEEITVRYLPIEQSYISFDVFCYGNYSIIEYPSWCNLTEQNEYSFRVKCSKNESDSIRLGIIYVEGGGKTIAIILEQEGLYYEEDVMPIKNVTDVELDSVIEPVIDFMIEPSSELDVIVEPLTLSHTSINASSDGITDYITVFCEKEWEVQYPNGSIYNATRMGDYVKVSVKTNNTSVARSDYFYVRTTDQKESVKITISQSPNITISSSDTYHVQRNIYQQYCDYIGTYEIIWYGMRAEIGTGVSYGHRLFSFRTGPVQINPIEFSVDYNIINGELAAIYTPSIDFFIPFQNDAAFYFGGGPSIHILDLDDNYVWADVSAGIHWHWGVSGSSDFFIRYNGNFMFGISIQWSTIFK